MSQKTQLQRIADSFQSHPEDLEPGCAALTRKETHISLVLLSSQKVYKFKKPVYFAFIDQESLAARRLNCEREIELNRRLAPDVYLGLRAVYARGDRFFLGDPPEEEAQGEAEVLDYCVVMRHLPDDRNLAQLLEAEAVDAGQITRIARSLADFHGACAGGEAVRSRRDFRKFFQENVQVLEQSGAVDAETLAGIQKLLRRETYPLKRREMRDLIVDGHGDLRLDHIYILPGADADEIRIIDCVEFNAQLRAVDPYEDLAFTTMSLKVAGRPDLAARLIADYAAWTGDFTGLRLLRLYEIYRASVRAKIDWFLFQEAETGERRDYYQGRFFAYLRFIERRLAARPERGGKIHLLVGLPATGKSSFAERLRGSEAVPIISSDVIRKRLSGVNLDRSLGSAAFAGEYAPAATERVYRRMIALARLALACGFDVVLDATFGKRSQRAAVARMARKTGAELAYYHVRAREDVVRERLERRRTRGGGPSDLVDFSIWQRMAADFEKFSPEELVEVSFLEVNSP